MSFDNKEVPKNFPRRMLAAIKRGAENGVDYTMFRTCYDAQRMKNRSRGAMPDEAFFKRKKTRANSLPTGPRAPRELPRDRDRLDDGTEWFLKREGNSPGWRVDVPDIALGVLVAFENGSWSNVTAFNISFSVVSSLLFALHTTQDPRARVGAPAAEAREPVFLGVFLYCCPRVFLVPHANR